MKACERCSHPVNWEERSLISSAYKEKPLAYKILCVLLIYLPLFSLPFVILSAVITSHYLKIAGANDLDAYWSFLPNRKSYRYDWKTQVTMESRYRLNPIRAKLFWIGNCTWYCPYSVALFEWHAYLIKRLENLKMGNDSDFGALTEDCPQIAFAGMGKSMAYNLVSALLLCIQSLNLPFVIFSGLITRLHLKMAGVINMKLFGSFLPENTSHANEVRRQVTLTAISWFGPLRCSPSGVALGMSYWVYSKALFDWHAYLVKVVENWWCPFYHDRKDPHYRIGSINQSYWHLYPEDVIKLDPEDRENPLWYSAENKKS